MIAVAVVVLAVADLRRRLDPALADELARHADPLARRALAHRRSRSPAPIARVVVDRSRRSRCRCRRRSPRGLRRAGRAARVRRARGVVHARCSRRRCPRPRRSRRPARCTPRPTAPGTPTHVPQLPAVHSRLPILHTPLHSPVASVQPEAGRVAGLAEVVDDRVAVVVLAVADLRRRRHRAVAHHLAARCTPSCPACTRRCSSRRRTGT